MRRSTTHCARSSWTAALAAAPGGWLFLGCGAESGAGQQVKVAYLSADGGRTWHKVASPPSGGYLGSASMNPAGTIFLSGERMNIYVSRDGGRHADQNLRGCAAHGNRAIHDHDVGRRGVGECSRR